jgi:hypothetical protein
MMQEAHSGAQFDITSECPTAPEVAAAIMRMDSKTAGADGIPTVGRPCVSHLFPHCWGRRGSRVMT